MADTCSYISLNAAARAASESAMKASVGGPAGGVAGRSAVVVGVSGSDTPVMGTPDVDEPVDGSTVAEEVLVVAMKSRWALQRRAYGGECGRRERWRRRRVGA